MMTALTLAADTTAYWLLRHEQRLLLTDPARTPDGALPFPCGPQVALPPLSAPPLLIGEWEGRPCLAGELAAPALEASCVPQSLRQVYALAGERAFALAGRAFQLLDWQQQHRFCGRCGSATTALAHEFAMRCPNCGLQVYPRLSPAIMVLVRDRQRLLLARSPHFKPGVYSALAGFVEAGETLEECAQREVREEVGIEIANLRYFASQPWPFPNSLMLAFVADYVSGDLTPAAGEIEAADWFTPPQLPQLPEPISISRRLIDAVVRGEL